MDITMAKTIRYHIVPNDEKGWAIKKEGSSKVSDYASTQRGAEKIAKRFASNKGGGEVIIHRRDGKIWDADTIFSVSDPFPPRDKRH
jgi:hypothetical protein